MSAESPHLFFLLQIERIHLVCFVKINPIRLQYFNEKLDETEEIRDEQLTNTWVKKREITLFVGLSQRSDVQKMSLLPTSSTCLLPGNQAPNFTLNSVMDNKEEQVVDLHIIKLIIRPSLNQVSLSSLRGKHVLLMFYPVDFGYVTPTEFYTLAPFLPLLAEFNCDVLAISTEHISSQKNSQAAPRSSNPLFLTPCPGPRQDWTG